MSKRRAVVGRGADEGQAERDVDAFVEVERLDRDQRLVVIHAEDRVVASRAPPWNIGIGGQRAGAVDALGARAPRPPGAMIVDLLAADRAALAGMRVEAGDGKPRRGDAEALGKRPSQHPGLALDCRPSNLPGTSFSGIWTVTGTLRSEPTDSIITGSAG